MTSLGAWMMVAAAGALHGLNPCSGWALAASRGLRAASVRHALRALAPLAFGHVVAVACVAVAAMHGLWLAASVSRWLSGALMTVIAGTCAIAFVQGRWRERHAARVPSARAPTHDAALALTSFVASTLNGSGLMLIPALMPICLSQSPAREITASGSMWLALAAVAVHGAAMLSVTAAMSLAARRI